MPEEIWINEALFGYLDGHRMLSASENFPKGAVRYLSAMTDSPGGSLNSEGSITGLPIPGEACYALFRTWPARNMPRPGCVWSHVVIITNTDLAKVRRLQLLRNIFREPRDKKDVSKYTKKHRISPHEHGTIAHEVSNDFLIKASLVLELLYNSKSDDIVILDNDIANWEDLVFDIWSQQWSSLRKNFSFSTGCVGDRRVSGIEFNLQIGARSSRSLWLRTSFPTVVVDRSDFRELDVTKDELSKWKRVALDDLLYPDTSSLRDLIRTYGDDIPGDRTCFKAFLSALVLLKQELPVFDSLVAISSLFPSASNATKLKLRYWKQIVDEQSSEHYFAALSFFLLDTRSSAYPLQQINIDPLVRLIAKEECDKVIWLLEQSQEREFNTLSDQLQMAISRSETLWKGLLRRNPRLLVNIIPKNTAIAYNRTVWETSLVVQENIFERLEDLSLSTEEWSNILGAMMVAATSVSVGKVIALAGEHVFFGAIKWFDSPISNEMLPSQNWVEALTKPAENTLAQRSDLSKRQLALALICASNNYLCQHLRADRIDLLRMAKDQLNGLEGPCKTYCAFIVMATALGDRGSNGLCLAVGVFEVVHEALRKQQFFPDCWILLENKLPRLGWFSDWDRCERLRRGMLQLVRESISVIEDVIVTNRLQCLFKTYYPWEDIAKYAK